LTLITHILICVHLRHLPHQRAILPQECHVTEQPALEPEVNVEAIMQQIRQQIIAKRAAVGPAAGGPSGASSGGDIVVTGKRLPPEFYEHLYQARLALDETQVPVFVSKSGVPIIGGLTNGLRAKLHELVTYYVNQSAARQASANEHLLRALSLLAQELEEEN
jgi:hypothetical protein